MKWTLLGVLAGLMVWSSLAYRMIPDPSEDGRTVLTWVSDDNPVRHDTISLFEQQKENAGIRIQLDPGSATLEKVVVQCKGGIGPEVFNVYGRWQLMDYIKTGVLLRLDRDAKEYRFTPDETWPAVRDEITLRRYNPRTGRYERHQYTFPANVNANVMFFNKRLFDEARVPYPSGDWTWDECLEVAKKLVVRDAKGNVTRYGIGTYEFLDATGLIWQFGGDLFDETLTYCVLDSPEAEEAITFLHRMFVIDEVMPPKSVRDAMGTQGGFGGGLLDLFAFERIAMIRIGRWALVTLRKYYDSKGRIRPLRGQLGAVQLPYKREKVGLVRALSVGINAKSPHRAEALMFMRFLASDKFSWQVVESADALPPSPAVARDQGFLNDPDYPEEDFNAQFVEAMRRGRNQAISPLIQTARVHRAFDRYIVLLSKDKLTPHQMCRQLTDEINEDVKTNLVRYESMRAEYDRRTGHPFNPDDFPPRKARP